MLYLLITIKIKDITIVKHLGKPRFDGSDPLRWIFKINHFSNFHKTPKEKRTSIASFYMVASALNWYK